MKALIGSGLAAALAVPTAMGALAGGWGTSSAEPSAQALVDIPAPLLAAYQAASPSCPGLPWTVLAAVGKVETDHGRTNGAELAVDGSVRPSLLGPLLDGTNGTARVVDTDGGRLDGNVLLDRGVGPMQFLPATWARWGRDASGDGVADINNAFDSIASAADYLCAGAGAGAGGLSDIAAAIARYNRSATYVEQVLTTAAEYGSFVGSGINPGRGAHPSPARTEAQPGCS